MADPVIEEVKRRTDIVELVSGQVALKKAGRYFKGLCPFHHEKTPSFVVYPENGTYHCFGCHVSGDAFSWLMETQKVTFGDALRELARRAGVALPERQPSAERSAEQEKERRLTEAAETAAAQFHRWLVEGAEGRDARAYLETRGISAESVGRFKLGYAQERWDALTKHLTAMGFAAEQLVEAGLSVEDERGIHDRFRGRLMFPIRDARGQVRGFGGRVLGGDVQPKYLNSPQTALFDKSALLYALDLATQAIRRADQAVIVEGYTDAIIAHQYGFANVVASLGTALTERQLDLLKRYSTRFVLALDADAAGALATERGLQLVQQTLDKKPTPVPTGLRGLIRYQHVMKGEVRVATLPAGQDPDDVIRADPEQWRRLVDAALPLTEYALRSALAQADLTTARGKSAAAHRVLPLIEAIPDAVEQGHYLERLAQALGITEGDLRTELRRDRRRQSRGAIGAPTGEGGTGATEDLPAGEPLESYYVSLLILAPDLLDRSDVRLSPTDLWRPEAREVYRTLVEQARRAAAAAEAPASATSDRLRGFLDPSLVSYYDEVVAQGARHPPFTRPQLLADLTQATLRLQERNLRERLRQAQMLLAGAAATSEEAPPSGTPPLADKVGERTALLQLVKELSDSLLRVQLARSRLPMYSSASS